MFDRTREKAGTKVGPDQLGSNKKNKNKIKLDLDQLGSTKNKLIKLAKLKI